MQKKGRPQNIIIIYYNTKILQEEACKQAIWKNSYWGFLGRQNTLKTKSKNELKSDK